MISTKLLFLSILNLILPLTSLSGTNINKTKLELSPIYNTYQNIDKVINKGKTYYVSPEATKTNHGTGLTREDPESIYLLEDSTKLQPGDTVILTGKEYVFESSYSRIYSNVSGEFNKYITIKSEGEENAVLNFYAAMFDSTLRGVTLNGSYIYWKGVDIKGAGDNGMYIGGNFNVIEGSSFYDNRDSGLQLGRASGDYASIAQWPSNNYIKNCTSYNNYDNETYGENADGFAAKLTIGYGNIFDGCIAYRNSDDGWDLYAKTDSGNIGDVIIYNCVAFENGFIAENQDNCNKKFPTFNKELFKETDANGKEKGYSYTTRDGDGNGFKLGGSIMEGNTYIYNSLAFNNKMHGITDNSNPGTIYAKNCTCVDNGAVVDDQKASSTYGQVVTGTSAQEAGEECANIDLSRQTYSYNVVENCLSLKSDWNTSIGNDALRGSIQNTIFGTEFSSNNAYDFTDPMDADTKEGITGTKITNYKIDDVFVDNPIVQSTAKTTYKLSGLKNSTIDKEFRNEDGSINLKDFFKIKDSSPLKSRNLGCDLSKSSNDEYDHFNLLDYSSFNDKDELTLAATEQSLVLPVNKNCVYQDFKMPNSIGNIKIEYSSDNEDVLKIGSLSDFSASGIRNYSIEVSRDLEEVKKVNLTIKFSYNGKEISKTHELSIQPGTPSIGDIYALNVDNNRVIVDAFSNYQLPKICVTNGKDYSNKVLSENKYNLETKYFYATDKNSTFYEVKGFTTSKPGVFKIYSFVSLKDSKVKKIYTYDVYVVSTSSNVDFENNVSEIQVNKDGFVISGNLTSAAGKLYVYTSDTQINADANLLISDGKSKTFRNDSISYSFTHENSHEYYVYYLISNLSGSYFSQVYESKINVVEIDSESRFNEIFSSDTKSNIIYTLTKDLDFSNVECTTAKSKKAFSGLFNGLGHSISNVKINRTSDGMASIWYKVENATIENVKFNNLYFNCGTSNKQAGIVATSYGGNFYNISINNVTSLGKERVAGLIGQAFEGEETNIEKVSLINDNNQQIKAESKDAAGIIGLCQTTSTPLVNYKVNIKNVLVAANIEASTYCGGIIGRFDDQKPTITYKLKVNKCVVCGSVKTSGNYCGGVIGGQVSSSRSEVYNCISMMDLYHKGSVSKLVISEKNSSPIMGRHPTGIYVMYCAATMAEYESGFDVVVYTNEQIKDINKVDNVSLDDCWTNDINKAPYYFISFED